MTSPAETRRERRAEQRLLDREQQRRRRTEPQRSPLRSPIVVATVIALAAGLVLIGALVLANRPATTGTGIVPANVVPAPAALVAAIAARVAQKMGVSFWTFHDLLYANQGAENKGSYSRDRLADMAVSLGLDRATFLAGMADKSNSDAVSQETSQGRALGVTSTPTLVINGQVYPGLPVYSKLTTLLDGLVANPSSVPATTAP